MAREFNVVIERDEEGLYVTSVPALPGCHTQVKSLTELDGRIVEAIELWLEEAAVEPARLHFVEVRTVTVAT